MSKSLSSQPQFYAWVIQCKGALGIGGGGASDGSSFTSEELRVGANRSCMANHSIYTDFLHRQAEESGR